MNLTGGDLLSLENSLAVNDRELIKVKLSGVSIDSRKCKKKDVFFAIKGERFDGHEFIDSVLKKGVGAVIAEKKWFLKNRKKRSLKSKKIILVDDTIKSLGELAHNYRNKFVIPVIAVAGSNGKTTVKDFVAHVLGSKYNVLKTEGNMNNAIGVPLTLFRLRKENEICVLELGTNHFGEIDYLCNIAEPQFGVITNIGKEHLEYFKDLNGVAKAECELVDWLKSNYGTFFLNADDSYLRRKSASKELKVFLYGSTGKTVVKGKIKKFKGFYPEIEIKHKNKIIKTELNTIGTQSFNAALAAAAMGFYFDVEPSKIKKAIGNFNSVTAKRNRLVSSHGINIIDDTYNSNPDSVIMALENLKKYKTAGLKHIVLADMLELGRTSKKEHFEIGKAIKKMGFDTLYTFGKDSFNTYKGAKGIANNFYFEDKATLSELLLHTVKKDDLVLVKGSRSMRMEEIINKLTKVN